MRRWPLRMPWLASDPPPEIDLPSSLEETIASADLREVGTDLAEIGVDAFLKDGGLIEQLPILKTMAAVTKAGLSIREALFAKKVVAFLHPTVDVEPRKRAEMLRALDDLPQQERAAERLLIVIDRLDSVSKAVLLGRLFRLLVDETIDKDEFWRLSFIIDRASVEDLQAVARWRSLDINSEVPHSRKHSYLGVGLVWFVHDLSSTGFKWEERLCSLLSDHLLKPDSVR